MALSLGRRSAPAPVDPYGGHDVPRGEDRRSRRQEGFALLGAIVAVMWVVEVIDTLAGGALERDGGIQARNVGDLWSIFTAPFIHQGFGHLIDNTIPLLFLGAIIALRGAARLAVVTLIVIVIGGLGTWLLSPGGAYTVGASGVVFGYATYLLTRGVFGRRVLEILVGLIVAVVWGAMLLASLVPHPGISWQGHLAGAVGGVIAARLLAPPRRRPPEVPVAAPGHLAG